MGNKSTTAYLMTDYKNYIVALLFLVIYANLFASRDQSSNQTYNSVLEKLRMTYYSGVEEYDYIDSLQTYIEDIFGKNISDYPPTILAYKAGIDALKSKHAFWPFKKMSYLNDSMSLFEEAIAKDPENLEIRFMRFSILYYVPGILGYGNETEEDLDVVYQLLLERDYSALDYEIQNGMIEFLLMTDLLSKDEENKLKNYLVSAKPNE